MGWDRMWEDPRPICRTCFKQSSPTNITNGKYGSLHSIGAERIYEDHDELCRDSWSACSTSPEISDEVASKKKRKPTTILSQRKVKRKSLMPACRYWTERESSTSCSTSKNRTQIDSFCRRTVFRRKVVPSASRHSLRSLGSLSQSPVSSPTDDLRREIRDKSKKRKRRGKHRARKEIFERLQRQMFNVDVQTNPTSTRSFGTSPIVIEESLISIPRPSSGVPSNVASLTAVLEEPETVVNNNSSSGGIGSIPETSQLLLPVEGPPGCTLFRGIRMKHVKTKEEDEATENIIRTLKRIYQHDQTFPQFKTNTDPFHSDDVSVTQSPPRKSKRMDSHQTPTPPPHLLETNPELKDERQKSFRRNRDNYTNRESVSPHSPKSVSSLEKDQKNSDVNESHSCNLFPYLTQKVPKGYAMGTSSSFSSIVENDIPEERFKRVTKTNITSKIKGNYIEEINSSVLYERDRISTCGTQNVFLSEWELQKNISALPHNVVENGGGSNGHKGSINKSSIPPQKRNRSPIQSSGTQQKPGHSDHPVKIEPQASKKAPVKRGNKRSQQVPKAEGSRRSRSQLRKSLSINAAASSTSNARSASSEASKSHTGKSLRATSSRRFGGKASKSPALGRTKGGGGGRGGGGNIRKKSYHGLPHGSRPSTYFGPGYTTSNRGGTGHHGHDVHSRTEYTATHLGHPPHRDIPHTFNFLESSKNVTNRHAYCPQDEVEYHSKKSKRSNAKRPKPRIAKAPAKMDALGHGTGYEARPPEKMDGLDDGTFYKGRRGGPCGSKGGPCADAGDIQMLKCMGMVDASIQCHCTDSVDKASCKVNCPGRSECTQTFMLMSTGTQVEETGHYLPIQPSLSGFLPNSAGIPANQLGGIADDAIPFLTVRRPPGAGSCLQMQRSQVPVRIANKEFESRGVGSSTAFLPDTAVGSSNAITIDRGLAPCDDLGRKQPPCEQAHAPNVCRRPPCTQVPPAKTHPDATSPSRPATTTPGGGGSSGQLEAPIVGHVKPCRSNVGGTRPTMEESPSNQRPGRRTCPGVDKNVQCSQRGKSPAGLRSAGCTGAATQRNSPRRWTVSTQCGGGRGANTAQQPPCKAIGVQFHGTIPKCQMCNDKCVGNGTKVPPQQNAMTGAREDVDPSHQPPRGQNGQLCNTGGMQYHNTMPRCQQCQQMFHDTPRFVGNGSNGAPQKDMAAGWNRGMGANDQPSWEINNTKPVNLSCANCQRMFPQGQPMNQDPRMRFGADTTAYARDDIALGWNDGFSPTDPPPWNTITKVWPLELLPWVSWNMDKLSMFGVPDAPPAAKKCTPALKIVELARMREAHERQRQRAVEESRRKRKQRGSQNRKGKGGTRRSRSSQSSRGSARSSMTRQGDK